MTQVSQAPWGELPGQGSVHLWLLQSPQLKVEILTLGATIKSVWSRGRDGGGADVVLGYDTLQGKGTRGSRELCCCTSQPASTCSSITSSVGIGTVWWPLTHASAGLSGPIPHPADGNWIWAGSSTTALCFLRLSLGSTLPRSHRGPSG